VSRREGSGLFLLIVRRGRKGFIRKWNDDVYEIEANITKHVSSIV
jgi:hypothetical protein